MLHDLSWHGRLFTVSIGPRTTSVTLNRGPTLTVETGARMRHVNGGQTISVATRTRPDLVPTDDVVRCGAAQATSSAPGAPALAAVDGSPATDWQPVAVPASLTVPLPGGPRTVTTATLTWGRTWPAAPAPNQPPPPGPVAIVRASTYDVAVSSTVVIGGQWRASPAG